MDHSKPSGNASINVTVKDTEFCTKSAPVSFNSQNKYQLFSLNHRRTQNFFGGGRLNLRPYKILIFF